MQSLTDFAPLPIPPADPVADASKPFSTRLADSIIRKITSLSHYAWLLVVAALAFFYPVCIFIFYVYLFPIMSWTEIIIVYGLIYHFVYYGLFWFFLKSHFTQPITNISFPPQPGYDSIVPFCQQCQEQKPPRTHHCGICNACIRKYDHHCFWVGSCIAAHNVRYFYLLVLYMVIGLCFCTFYVGRLLIHNSDSPYVTFWILFVPVLIFANVLLVSIVQTALYTFFITTNLTMMEAVVYLGQCYREWAIVKLPYFTSITASWREAFLLPPNIPVVLGFLPFDFSQFADGTKHDE